MRRSLRVLCALLAWCLLVPAAPAQLLNGPGRVVGQAFRYTVQEGDTLARLAARFGVERAALAQRNRLAPHASLQPGQVLDVDNRSIVPETMDDGILINIPQRKLFLFRDGELVAHYPIAAGAPDNPTPLGDFHIDIMLRDPWWTVPPSARAQMRAQGRPEVRSVPPGPGNPLAGYWIGLGRPGYGIHGTTAPASIYGFRSLGCVRMQRRHVAELFDLVQPGMAVRIIYQPVLLARAADGSVFLEAHPDPYGLSRHAPLHSLQLQAAAAGVSWRLDWTRAQRLLRQRSGLAHDVGRPLGALHSAVESTRGGLL